MNPCKESNMMDLIVTQFEQIIAIFMLLKVSAAILDLNK